MLCCISLTLTGKAQETVKGVEKTHVVQPGMSQSCSIRHSRVAAWFDGPDDHKKYDDRFIELTTKKN